MKRRIGVRRIAKGASSGLVVSLLVHLGIFLAAGTIVVLVNVIKMPEPFRPINIPRRDPMNLKTPRVRISRHARPESATRLVVEVKDQVFDFSLPNTLGNGESLMDGIGVGNMFSIEPPQLPDTVFTDPEHFDTGNSLVVHYYNLNRRRDGGKLNIGHEEYFAALRKFVRNGWRTADLSRFYCSPNKLFATTIMIPMTPSSLGPEAFGEDVNEGYCWVAHYKGRLAHKEGLTFRFWGASDDVMTVRVGGRVVLAANFEWTGVDAHTIADDWVSDAPNNRRYRLGNDRMVGGDWITLKPGESLPMEAIVGEGPGGEFQAQLLVEVKGETYPLNSQGAPIFPIFAMEEPSWALQDMILANMFEGEANVTNVTTIFRDY